MTRVVFDIETDSLKPSKIWCLVAKNIDSGQLYTFGPDQIEQACDLLEKSTYLVGHNILGYDIPVLERLTGRKVVSENTKVVDTLILSRLFNPTRSGPNAHALATWGAPSRLNFPKIVFEEYDRYSAEMLDYCIRDVELNLEVFKYLQKEGKGFSVKSVMLEHEVSKILERQTKQGFLIDQEKAYLLLAQLRERLGEVEENVRKIFKPKIEEIVLTPKRKKDGNISRVAKGGRLTNEEYEQAVAKNNLEPIKRYKTVEFNLGSRMQIGQYLQEFGWKPQKFTEHGRPIVDEKVLMGVKGIPEASLIAEYLLVQKRIAQVDSWLNAIDDKDGRVHGFIKSTGAITGRMTHMKPNMAQVPNLASPYGKECRECWIVDKGNKLVGIDASGLEIRMLAHYMKDEDYRNEIINGDIHTTNQKLAGLESRNQAKTFIYALIYGAGNKKLGQVVGGNTTDGERLKQRFLHNLGAFKDLKKRVSEASGRGYLKGLDGRKILIRSEYAALNTLLQSAGAVAMKEALVILDKKIKEKGYEAEFVANVHDEWQIEVREDHAEEVGKAGVEAIQEAGISLGLFCPLDGEYKIGDNWSETH
jgi:DNA polymerase I-like protein with 3'-5' exonuclease and polymerase domains